MELDLAIAQFRPTKGDPEASLADIQEVLGRAAALDPRPRLIAFPETALTGYFLEGGVREHSWPAQRLFRELRARYVQVADPEAPLDVAIGFFEVHRERVYNSALYAELGGPDPRILHVHRKVFLPTYGVFQEERFVEAGAGIRAFDTSWGRAALLICEDAFHSISPTLAALDAAQVIVVHSASPARGTRPGPGVPGNLERWDRLAGGIAQEHGVFVVVSQLVGFEGGKGFPGGSTAFGPRGQRLVRGPLWEDALLPLRLEVDELFSARVEEPLLSDLEAAWARLLASSPGARSPVGGGKAAPSKGQRAAEVPPEGGSAADVRPEGGSAANVRPEGRTAANVRPEGGSAADVRPEGRTAANVRPEGGNPGGKPFQAGGAQAQNPEVRLAARERGTAAGGSPRLLAPLGPDPADGSPLAIDAGLVEEWLLQFLRDEVVRNRGFRRVVVGMSGGADSSLTAALCARALGPEAVTGFLLPYRTSSPESAEHAELVARRLGVETLTVEITDAVDGYLERYEPDASDRRRGNVAARQRMIVLFDQAAKLDALPVGTGNKSERLLGYFTWHADDSPPINPLGDLFKTQVWALARHMGLPEEIVEKPATADLIRGQTDEEDLGISYPEADLILHWLLNGCSPARLERHGFDSGKVEIVLRRLEGTHWKRHLPTVAMLSSTAIGEWYLRPVDY